MPVDYVSNSITGQTPLLESWHRGEFMVSEAERNLSRDQGILTGGTKVFGGTILGKITDAAATAPTVTPGAGNAGNGTLTPDISAPEQSAAQAGIYSVKFDSATKFTVFDPAGNEVGVGTVGTVFNNQIKFNTAAGGNAWALDDTIAVNVPAGSGKYAPLNTAGVDGTENAAAILFGTTDVTLADAKVTLITRMAEVNAAELIWPAGITTNQQATATAQLAALGIILR